jgi:hypothetical protein
MTLINTTVAGVLATATAVALAAVAPAAALRATDGAAATQAVAAGEDLSPLEGRTVELGEMRGIVYYTAEPDGMRLVATLAAGEEGVPVRIVTTLADGQSLVLSAPRAPGVAPHRTEIVRHGARVSIAGGSVAMR